MAERRPKVVPISKRLRVKRERRAQVRAIAGWFRVPVEAIHDVEASSAEPKLSPLAFLLEAARPAAKPPTAAGGNR